MTTAHDRHPEFLDDQREFFDHLVVEDWESYRSDEWDALRRHEVEALFRLVSGRRVIDIGCGVGFHDAVMADLPGVEEVVGIDYSPKSIEVAEREYPHPRVSRRAADLYELQPADFDLAVSFQVIEHLTEPERFLAACAAQVRRGGAVAVITPNRLRLDNRLRALRRRPLELVDPQHFSEYTAAELRELGARAGLQPGRGFGYGFAITVPRSGAQLRAPRFGSRLGHLGRWGGSSLCQVFEVAG